MNRGDLIKRVRSYTRDLSSSIFRQIDVTDYINEGIDRFRSRIPQLKNMSYLTSDSQPISLLPEPYHYLLAVFSASRCFFQDEREYKASTLMNEFETKLEELLQDIEDGKVVIVDENGDEVVIAYESDYVKNVYFDGRNYEGESEEVE